MNIFCKRCKRADCPKPFASEKGKPLCFPDSKEECYLCLRIDKLLVVQLARNIWGKKQGLLLAKTAFGIFKEAYFTSRGKPKMHCKIQGKSAKGLICGGLYLAQLMVIQEGEAPLLVWARQKDIIEAYKQLTGKNICIHSLRGNYANLRTILKYPVPYDGARPLALQGRFVRISRGKEE